MLNRKLYECHSARKSSVKENWWKLYNTKSSTDYQSILVRHASIFVSVISPYINNLIAKICQNIRRKRAILRRLVPLAVQLAVKGAKTPQRALY